MNKYKTKKGKKRHVKKNTRRNKGVTNKNPSVYIHNFGSTKTLIKTNNKNSKREVKWIGDYNGKEANIQVDVIKDNDRKVFNINMDNNEISRLLGIQPVNIPIDERLRMDFLSDENNMRLMNMRPMNMNMGELLITIPNKRKKQFV